MNIILGGLTALTYWRNYHSTYAEMVLRRLPGKDAFTVLQGGAVPKKLLDNAPAKAAFLMRPQGLTARECRHVIDSADFPESGKQLDEHLTRIDFLKELHCSIELIVPYRKRKLTSSLANFHVWTNPFPDGALVKLDLPFPDSDEVFVTSPAFTTMLLAKDLSVPELIKLGDEFCGSFAETTTNDDGYVRRPPLATPEAFTQTITQCAHVQGIAKARRAFPFIVAGSASPMESVQQMLFCLPRRMGGYGIPNFKLNYRIDLTDELKAASQRQYLIGDLVIPNSNICIEYNGRKHYISDWQRELDIERTNLLVRMHYDVFTLTYNLLCNESHLESIAKHIKEDLKIAERPTTQKHRIAREALRKELLRVWDQPWFLNSISSEKQ